MSIIRPTSGLSPPAHTPSTAKIALRNGSKANEGQIAKRREKRKPSTTSQTGAITSFEGVSKTRFIFERQKHKSPSLHFFSYKETKKASVKRAHHPQSFGFRRWCTFSFWQKQGVEVFSIIITSTDLWSTFFPSFRFQAGNADYMSGNLWCVEIKR